VFGTWPIAMKIPPQGTCFTSPVFTFFTIAPVTPFPGPPRTFSITLSSSQATFGLAFAWVCMALLARSSARRCTTVTFEANLLRKDASSMAVSPPPTTRTSLPL